MEENKCNFDISLFSAIGISNLTPNGAPISLIKLLMTNEKYITPRVGGNPDDGWVIATNTPATVVEHKQKEVTDAPATVVEHKQKEVASIDFMVDIKHRLKTIKTNALLINIAQNLKEGDVFITYKYFAGFIPQVFKLISLLKKQGDEKEISELREKIKSDERKNVEIAVQGLGYAGKTFFEPLENFVIGERKFLSCQMEYINVMKDPQRIIVIFYVDDNHCWSANSINGQNYWTSIDLIPGWDFLKKYLPDTDVDIKQLNSSGKENNKITKFISKINSEDFIEKTIESFEEKKINILSKTDLSVDFPWFSPLTILQRSTLSLINIEWTQYIELLLWGNFLSAEHKLLMKNMIVLDNFPERKVRLMWVTSAEKGLKPMMDDYINVLKQAEEGQNMPDYLLPSKNIRQIGEKTIEGWLDLVTLTLKTNIESAKVSQSRSINERSLALTILNEYQTVSNGFLKLCDNQLLLLAKQFVIEEVDSTKLKELLIKRVELSIKKYPVL